MGECVTYSPRKRLYVELDGGDLKLGHTPVVHVPCPGDELLGDIRTGGEPVQGVVTQGDDLLGQLGVEPDVFDVVDLVTGDAGNDRDHGTGIIPVGQGGEHGLHQHCRVGGLV